LQSIGQQAGLETIDFSTQSQFLERLGFLDKVQILQRKAFKDLRADFELQRMLSLYLPDGLGDACKVLIQAKMPSAMLEASEPRGETGER
jgi:SAM-dependent MidA family methyltransferase